MKMRSSAIIVTDLYCIRVASSAELTQMGTLFSQEALNSAATHAIQGSSPVPMDMSLARAHAIFSFAIDAQPAEIVKKS